jgi:hypothetical protein
MGGFYNSYDMSIENMASDDRFFSELEDEMFKM